MARRAGRKSGNRSKASPLGSVLAAATLLVAACGATGRGPGTTAQPTALPTPAPTATPWRLSVTDTTYSRKVLVGDDVVVTIKVKNSGSTKNPSTEINFTELDKYADLFECKPKCEVQDLPGSGPSAILPGVAAGKTTAFRITFIAGKAGAVHWSACLYDDESFGDQVWCGDATTAIK